MKVRSRSFYRKLGWVLLGFCCVALIFEMQSDEGLLPEAGKESKLSKVASWTRKVREFPSKFGRELMKEDENQFEISDYVRNQQILSPINVNGVNDDSIRYYRLTDGDVDEIKNLINRTRDDILSEVVNSLNSENADGGVIIYTYMSKDEFSSRIYSQFYDGLDEIAGSEFANAGVASLRGDHRFLGGGQVNLRFIVHPPTIGNDGSKKVIVRAEEFSSNGKVGQHWEGDATILARSRGIDFTEE